MKKIDKTPDLNGATFNACVLDADATKVAQSIADAVAEIAQSNARAADALNALATRFCSPKIDSMVRVDKEGATIAGCFFYGDDAARKPKL